MDVASLKKTSDQDEEIKISWSWANFTFGAILGTISGLVSAAVEGVTTAVKDQ